MATFDGTTLANNAGWANGVKVKTFTQDFKVLKDTKGFATGDELNIIAVPPASGLVCLGGTVEVLRTANGTTTIDVGISGGAEFDSAQSIVATAGTITAFSTSIGASAANVLYSNTGGTTTYVTIENNFSSTDPGKIAVTLFYIPVGNGNL